MASQTRARLGATSLHRTLDVLEESVAPVTQEELLAGQTDVDPPDLAVPDLLDDRCDPAAVAEGAREYVAEAAGDRDQGHRQTGRRGCRGTQGGVSAHADEVRERQRALSCPLA